MTPVWLLLMMLMLTLLLENTGMVLHHHRLRPHVRVAVVVGRG